VKHPNNFYAICIDYSLKMEKKTQSQWHYKQRIQDHEYEIIRR
jgi:hypothetical protein